jgi:hypothetical protein
MEDWMCIKRRFAGRQIGVFENRPEMVFELAA